MPDDTPRHDLTSPRPAPVPPHVRRIGQRLHAQGERPVTEALALALAALDPVDRERVTAALERIAAWDPGVIRRMDAHRFAPTRLTRIDGGRQ